MSTSAKVAGWLASMCWGLCCVAAVAQNQLPPAPSGGEGNKRPAAQLAEEARDRKLKLALRKYERAIEALSDETPDNPTKEDVAEQQKKYEAAMDGLRATLQQLVDEDPKDATALTCLQALLEIPQSKEKHAEAMALLLKHHVKSEEMLGVLANMEGQELTEADRQLTATVLKENPKEDVKAVATLVLVQGNIQEINNPATAAERRKELRTATAQMLESLQGRYGRVTYNGNVMSDVATQGLHALEHLTVGQKAPELESVDLDNQPVKLSAYRGKVILLDFWATWCPPCVEMIPEEREIVDRYKDKPFVMIGVSMDDDRETVKEFQQQMKMPWVHWWEGPEGTGAPKFQPFLLPTIYLLDGEGVVRYRDLYGEELDRAIATLVAEQEKQAGKGPAGQPVTKPTTEKK